MAATVVETEAAPCSDLRARVGDAARRVARVPHEARMLRSVATDAAEAGAYKARRAVKMAGRDLSDARDEAVHRIKRQPFKAVGVAFGAGALLGVAVTGLAWLVARAEPPATA